MALASARAPCGYLMRASHVFERELTQVPDRGRIRWIQPMLVAAASVALKPTGIFERRCSVGCHLRRADNEVDVVRIVAVAIDQAHLHAL